MSKYDISVPVGELATSPSHAKDIALSLGMRGIFCEARNACVIGMCIITVWAC